MAAEARLTSPQYYLSLDNSLAARSGPGPAGGPTRRDVSYPAPLYQLVRPRLPELEHVNPACGGETAAGTIHGGACDPQLDGHARYATGTQRERR